MRTQLIEDLGEAILTRRSRRERLKNVSIYLQKYRLDQVIAQDLVAAINALMTIADQSQQEWMSSTEVAKRALQEWGNHGNREEARPRSCPKVEEESKGLGSDIEETE